MTIEDFIPTEILRPFIKTYKIIESQEALENRVLPNTSLAMAFRCRGLNSYSTATGKNNLPNITLSGLRKSVRLINYSKNTSTLIVLFKECGASAFLKEPLHELFEKSISLDSIIHSSELMMIEELLGEAQNNLQRVAIVEQFLLKKINCLKLDKLVSEAVTKIHCAKGFIKIKELANTLCISHDAFEKRFRKIVGSSPKQFASIVRMTSVVHQKSDERLWDIALDAGFYDQAHFNKDFKLFTGQTPTDFYKSASFW
jgi:AraC-like DNA-binding protein